MQIEFKDCEFKHSFYTSSQIDSTKDNRCRGMKTMEMHVRDVYGFRSIGVGHTPLTKLCGFLNMPPPMTKNAYGGLSYWITAAFKQVAKKSMYDASARLRWTKQTTDAGISVEVAWQRKGFSSTLEVVIAISIDNGKVLDVAILSKSWKDCTSMKKLPLWSHSLRDMEVIS